MDAADANQLTELVRLAGATHEEVARGLAAAQAVFDKAGITAERAAAAIFNVEGWDIAGFPDDDASYPDDEDFEFLGVWDEADRAAAAAACRDWLDDKRPKSAGLELFEEETDARRDKLQGASEAYKRGVTPEQFEKEWQQAAHVYSVMADEFAKYPPSSEKAPAGLFEHRCEHPGCKDWAAGVFREARRPSGSVTSTRARGNAGARLALAIIE